MAVESVAVVEPLPRTWRLSPAVLIAAGVVALAAPVRLGLSPYALMVAGALAVLVVLSAIDLQARILPNRILGPASLAVFGAQLVFYPEHTGGVMLAALGAGVLTLAPCFLNPAAMGMGDVKLAAFLGLLLGAKVFPALMLGFAATAPVFVALLVLHGRAARRMTLPLGPFLALGAAVVLLA
jgi:leader peptidase (prepilin peptidase)/N-methyltransferase